MKRISVNRKLIRGGQAFKIKGLETLFKFGYKISIVDEIVDNRFVMAITGGDSHV